MDHGTTRPCGGQAPDIVDLVDELVDVSDEHLMWLAAAVSLEIDRRNQLDRSVGLWNPWAELRRRRYLELRWVDFSAGTTGTTGGQVGRAPFVAIDYRLATPARAETLTHELWHDTLGVLPASAPADVRQADELVVEWATEISMRHAVAS